MLAIQKALRSGKETLTSLQQDPYNLTVKTDEESGYVLFKYSQIDSDLSLEIVNDSRGLILDSQNDWNVVSLSFRKFFNLSEHELSYTPDSLNIDWDSLFAYKKYDGSMIGLYFSPYHGEWKVHTTGTLYAESSVGGGESITNNQSYESFSKLFWGVFDRLYDKEDTLAKLDRNLTYTFELCTVYNQVVVYHDKPKLPLLAVRNNDTLEEHWPNEYDHLFDVPECVSVSSLSTDELEQFVEENTGSGTEDEGFVFVDSKFNRFKIKTEDYVFAHKSKDSIESRKYGFLEAYLDGKKDDVCAVMPEYEEDFDYVETIMNAHVEKLEYMYCDIFNGPSVDPDNHEKRKTFAKRVNNVCHHSFERSFMFQRLSTDKTTREIIYNTDYRKIGDYLSLYISDIN